jgi:hypothetical protein
MLDPADNRQVDPQPLHLFNQPLLAAPAKGKIYWKIAHAIVVPDAPAGASAPAASRGQDLPSVHTRWHNRSI